MQSATCGRRKKAPALGGLSGHRRRFPTDDIGKTVSYLRARMSSSPDRGDHQHSVRLSLRRYISQRPWMTRTASTTAGRGAVVRRDSERVACASPSSKTAEAGPGQARYLGRLIGILVLGSYADSRPYIGARRTEPGILGVTTHDTRSWKLVLA